MLTIFRNYSIKLLFLAVTCIVGASCATIPRDEAAIDTATLNESEGIVFFSVSTHQFRKIDGKLTDESTRTIAYNLTYNDTSRFFGRSGSIEGDTNNPDFFVVRRLPAGKYAIQRLDATIGTISASSRTNIHFTVVPKTITYLGALRLEFHENKGISGQFRAALPVTIEVSDDRDNATKLFSARYPDVKHDILANMMKIMK